LYRFRVIARFSSKVANFNPPHLHLSPPYPIRISPYYAVHRSVRQCNYSSHADSSQGMGCGDQLHLCFFCVCVSMLYKVNGLSYQHERWYECSPWQPVTMLRKQVKSRRSRLQSYKKITSASLLVKFVAAVAWVCVSV